MRTLAVTLALVAALLFALAPGCGAGQAPEAAPAPDAPPAEATRAPRTPPPRTPASPPLETDTLGARAPLPPGFVYLRDVAPDIAQEIRYATRFNFLGVPIRGYEAPECILTEQAAQALADVATDLSRRGLGLKVYDCYRPQRAVDHFVDWAYDPYDQVAKTAFYPEEPKNTLFRRGYISRRSGHSRGSTVDLTLVRQPAAASVVPEALYPRMDEHAPRCDAPRGERFDERDLDMGTGFDCFSDLSATESPLVSAEAQRNRRVLREAMRRHGFVNYSREWWHFSLRNEPFDTAFDFPVR
ncbi:MAG: M15 family metallopeptidase [Rubricoccaceae bacterium]